MKSLNYLEVGVAVFILLLVASGIVCVVNTNSDEEHSAGSSSRMTKEYSGAIDIYHDNENCVTCYKVNREVYCIPDPEQRIGFCYGCGI